MYVCVSLTLTHHGRPHLLKFNMGTPIDRTAGNSGGMGGLFAFLHFVGKPLPIRECQPYKMSFRFRLLTGIGNLASKLAKKDE
mmetsp:Transcript_30197/g.80748  ORF Transcript_30197/g.80748 Transcript_30197/m.80748 type:complete len:83 (+) Transcript_30197:43-291(+)